MSRQTPTGDGRIATAPTADGYGVGVAVAVLAVAAIGLGYPQFLLLVLGGVAAGVFAVACTWRPPGVDVVLRVKPDHISRGEHADAAIELTNRATRSSPPFQILVPVGDTSVSIAAGAVPAGSRVEVQVPLTGRRRGPLDVGPVVLRRTDPLGLLSRRWSTHAAATLLVLPVRRDVPIRDLAEADTGSALSGGRAYSGGVTFQGIRKYVAGDDLRRIHWRSFAKTGELMVREEAAHGDPAAIVLLDARAASYGSPAERADRFELATDVAASIVLAASAHGYRARLSVYPEDTDGLHLPSVNRLLATLCTARLSEEPAARELPFARIVISGTSADLDISSTGRFRGATIVQVGPAGALPSTGGDTDVVSAPDLDQFVAAWSDRAVRR
ncbi:DUF58 domain-containing protein [Cryptosporangium phraense]|uniref:DUF58 domain-containing protein n=1 Tax=Cryptosporangium phraense TaxID=2593070 RepID=A0A545AKY3_9ACTN|nr:DUF58 domain-containing protein [Cryptosporangium phraense]TQS41972.1 DUF58 domain-containing protein [Cryptosporangium phraense]